MSRSQAAVSEALPAWLREPLCVGTRTKLFAIRVFGDN